METKELKARTEIKGDDQLKRATKYCEENKGAEVVTNEKSGKTYLEVSFKSKLPSTFDELVKEHDEKEIVQKFNEIHVIRLQDSKRNALKSVIEDKPVSITALVKASGLSAEEIAKRLGIGQ